MDGTSKDSPIPERELHYFRQRLKNHAFEEVVTFCAEQARRQGVTRKDIAARLRKDPAQITRWLNAPSNLTLETLSDLLRALNAELELRVVGFADKPKPNLIHPLMREALAISGDAVSLADPWAGAPSQNGTNVQFGRLTRVGPEPADA